MPAAPAPAESLSAVAPPQANINGAPLPASQSPAAAKAPTVKAPGRVAKPLKPAAARHPGSHGQPRQIANKDKATSVNPLTTKPAPSSMRNSNVHLVQGMTKSAKLLEVKIHNVSTAAPTADRKGVEKKIDGTYKPRTSFAGMRTGMCPELIAWLEKFAESLYDVSSGIVAVPVEFHDDFDQTAFLENEGCTEHASGDVDGAFHIIAKSALTADAARPRARFGAGKTKLHLRRHKQLRIPLPRVRHQHTRRA